VSTAILFSPANVERVLADLPSVAAFLPDPTVEGMPSEAFPAAFRKTHREVYRWIANTHYEHLAAVLDDLERVYAAGCMFESLLTTTDRDFFSGLTAEVLVAEDLLRRGYTVKTIPRTDEPSPDLLVVMPDGLDVAVEVYSPRELLAIDAWVHEVKDLLNYVDMRASYNFSFETRLEQTIPPERQPFDPWAPADMLAQTRDAVVVEITRDVEESLRDLRSLHELYRHAGTPLRRRWNSTTSGWPPSLARKGMARSPRPVLVATHRRASLGPGLFGEP
jgi:hypothetical protein